MEKQEIKHIMKETCFNSLSFCCGLTRTCQYRDNVIKKLGLSKEDYIKLKEKFDNELFKKLK